MKLGFIGIGEIASAVVKGLCTSGAEDLVISISPRNEIKSTQLVNEFDQVEKLESNQAVIDNSDIVFFALRPKDANEAIESLDFRKEQVVVSLIPFLKLNDLNKLVKPATKICRAIPLPTVVNHSCPIPIFNRQPVVEQIFQHIGQPLIVEDEKQLHALWTLTGLIAPFYDLLSSLGDWAVNEGVSSSTAAKYITDMYQSVLASAQNNMPIDFYKLINHASTPNGMNEQAKNEIASLNAHEAYTRAADNLLKRFE